MNKLFCSTGTLVGRVCGYDYSLIKKHLPMLFNKGIIDGMEFMMIPYYYEKSKDVINTVLDSQVPSPIIHCEKEIGVLFSECDDTCTKKALELLKINCEIGKSINSRQMVFHLWGGPKSDYRVEYNISLLSQVIDIVKSFDMELLIENIPCTTHSGLRNWKKISEDYPNISFIFDTRFGAFHDEIDEILNSSLWRKVKHMHISDYSSFPRDFSKIRPILHPGEGVIDFTALFKSLKDNLYSGTLTLESPVMIPEGADIKKLEKSLVYIRNNI